MLAPTKTLPSDTVGDDTAVTALAPVHSGVHFLGTPPQPALPAASKAQTLPEFAPLTYTEPFATAGAKKLPDSGIGPFQRGAHVFGTPEQLVSPAASSATSPAPPLPYNTPPDTAKASLGPVHAVVNVDTFVTLIAASNGW